MIIDNTLVLSDNQAITVDAASTNIIDFLAVGTPYGWASPRVPDRGVGFKQIPLLVQVTEAFATLTSLTVSLQVDNDVAFGSPTTVATSAAIVAASLVPGYRFKFLSDIPEGVNERYMRIYYDVTGSSATAGKIFAAITAGIQTN